MNIVKRYIYYQYFLNSSTIMSMHISICVCICICIHMEKGIEKGERETERKKVNQA